MCGGKDGTYSRVPHVRSEGGSPREEVEALDGEWREGRLEVTPAGGVVCVYVVERKKCRGKM